MSNIEGVGKKGFDPKFSLLLVGLAVVVLFFSAVSIGVVAFFVMSNHDYADTPTGFYVLATTTTLKRSVDSTTASTTTEVGVTTTEAPSVEGPTTTFLEYIEPPTSTTLAAVDEECNPSYRGPFRSCGAKNLAWFYQWA